MKADGRRLMAEGLRTFDVEPCSTEPSTGISSTKLNGKEAKGTSALTVRESLWDSRDRKGIPVGQPSAFDEDIDILARTVYGEARGESRQGKIAVAWTVVNRVESPVRWWGKTVKDVCLHPMQYSCWNKSDPNRKIIEKITRSNPNFEECYQVARQVLDKEFEDLSKGATHYYARTIKQMPIWALDKTPVARIGNHLFFKNIN